MGYVYNAPTDRPILTSIFVEILTELLLTIFSANLFSNIRNSNWRIFCHKLV